MTDALRATIGTPEGLYGRRKMADYLRRQGHRVAACTVDRLMRDEGLSGIVGGRKHREAGGPIWASTAVTCVGCSTNLLLKALAVLVS